MPVSAQDCQRYDEAEARLAEISDTINNNESLKMTELIQLIQEARQLKKVLDAIYGDVEAELADVSA